MDDTRRLHYLRIALAVFGVVMIVGLYPLMLFGPSGWAWHDGYSDYQLMIVGVYATLGVFLLRAARDPLAHLSLVWFTVWSSVVHGAIMAVQSFAHAGHRGHLLGDVPVLFVVALVLAALTPRREASAVR